MLFSRFDLTRESRLLLTSKKVLTDAVFLQDSIGSLVVALRDGSRDPRLG
jgi:hypothetical protein